MQFRGRTPAELHAAGSLRGFPRASEHHDQALDLHSFGERVTALQTEVDLGQPLGELLQPPATEMLQLILATLPGFGPVRNLRGVHCRAEREPVAVSRPTAAS